MAANVLHFGQELSYCFPFLRKAGYSIYCYERLLEFSQALQSGVGHDAVSLCDVEDGVSRFVVLTARAHSRAPLILFRKGTVIPFQAGEREYSGIQKNDGSDFDLVISAAASPWKWISDIDRLIARSREIQRETQRINEMSVLIRGEATAAVEKGRFEREGGELEGTPTASMADISMPRVDKVLKCAVCREEFVFTVGEQLFFRLHNFTHDPKHCRSCRPARRNGALAPRQETAVTCAECGTSTTVPFKPFRGQPVLCRACFEKDQKTD